MDSLHPQSAPQNILADFPLKVNSAYSAKTIIIEHTKSDGGDFVLYRRIRDLREDSDLTQRELGEILHCSQRVYSNYERGELDIPTEILIRLADFYGVSVDYLLNRTDNREL